MNVVTRQELTSRVFRSESGENFISIFLYREKHSQDYCAMYDICGKRSDGKIVNCPYGSPAVKVFLILLFIHLLYIFFFPKDLFSETLFLHLDFYSVI